MLIIFSPMETSRGQITDALIAALANLTELAGDHAKWLAGILLLAGAAAGLLLARWVFRGGLARFQRGGGLGRFRA